MVSELSWRGHVETNCLEWSTSECVKKVLISPPISVKLKQGRIGLLSWIFVRKGTCIKTGTIYSEVEVCGRQEECTLSLRAETSHFILQVMEHLPQVVTGTLKSHLSFGVALTCSSLLYSHIYSIQIYSMTFYIYTENRVFINLYYLFYFRQSLIMSANTQRRWGALYIMDFPNLQKIVQCNCEFELISYVWSFSLSGYGFMDVGLPPASPSEKDIDIKVTKV